MKKLKKFVCFIVLMFVCFSFCGCGVNLTTTERSDGSIVSILNFDLSNLGASSNKIKTAVEIASKYTSQLSLKYEEKLVELFSNVYDFNSLGLTDKKSKLTYIILQNEKYAMGQTITPNLQENYAGATELKIETSFVSIYGFVMYNYPNAFVWDEESSSIKLNSEVYSTLIDVPVADSNLTKDEQIFFTTYTQTCTPFSYNGEEPKLLENTKINGSTYPAGTTLVEVASSALNLSQTEAEYVFKFITPYNRVSSNGGYSLSNGNYVHTWNFGNDFSKQVTLFRHYANYVAWYVLGLSLGILVLVFGGGIVAVSNKIKKKKGLKTLQKINEFMLQKQNEESNDFNQKYNANDEK